MQRRVPRQARAREKLARVLEAADRLLAEEGVEALTTTRVAAAAGVSVGALYQYLPDRDAITEPLAEGTGGDHQPGLRVVRDVHVGGVAVVLRRGRQLMISR